MMVVGSCMALWLLGVLFLSSNYFSGGVTRSVLVSGMITVDGGSRMTTSRNLKENIDHKNCGGDVSLEDYRPFDPSPNSKASVRPGPVEHGAPLMPYIPNPKPSPPHPCNHDESP